MALEYPTIDPVAVDLGFIQVHWYGLMYLFGFIAAFILGRKRAARPDSPMKPEQVEDMIFYGALGVVLGGRLGYVFFYDFEKFLEDPMWMFRVWEGGMAFHGGLIGVLFAMYLYSRKLGVRYIRVVDFLAPLVPIGLGLGRIGNFIGGELWGRATDVSWAMVFPNDPTQLARHPSQLYQFALEGILLFSVLWWFSRKPRPPYAVAAMFMLFYGIFRFVIEFVRQPDSHIGFVAWDWLTMGQILSTPMIALGLFGLYWAYNKESLPNYAQSAKK